MNDLNFKYVGCYGMTKLTIFIWVALVFGAIGLNAESAKLKLSKEIFSEQYSSNVPVSGRVIAGLMLSQSQSANIFSIYMPKSEKKFFCLRVLSRDGTYSSTNQYLLESNTTGDFLQADYPTKYADLLSKYSETELAVLAYTGKCEANKVTDILVSTRGSQADSKDAMILVSSGRSDVFLNIPLKVGGKKTIKCKRIEDGKRTGYDTSCKVNLSLLTTGTNELSLLRRKSGRMLPSVKFNLLYDQ
jgi:hypothetical protein